MGFTDTVTWTGQQLTLGELREFVARAVEAPDQQRVTVTVDQRFNNPTDPGGTIRISTSRE